MLMFPQRTRFLSLISLLCAIQGSRWDYNDHGRTSQKFLKYQVWNQASQSNIEEGCLQEGSFKVGLWVRVPKRGGTGIGAQIPYENPKCAWVEMLWQSSLLHYFLFFCCCFFSSSLFPFFLFFFFASFFFFSYLFFSFFFFFLFSTAHFCLIFDITHDTSAPGQVNLGYERKQAHSRLKDILSGEFILGHNRE